MSNATEAFGRRAVRSRSAGRCEAGLRDCLGIAHGWHHRLPRSGDGTWSPANGLDLCGSGVTGCHGRIESEREWAYWQGLLVPRGTNPEDVPVRLHHPVYGPAWWTLLPDGLMIWADPYEQERP